MIGYGFAKAFPLQMPAPSLTRLLEPYGNFSPMGVLWYSIGASFPYEGFVGLRGSGRRHAACSCPARNWPARSVCIRGQFEVFMLNMTYDVPVKLFSFHLVVMSVVLMAPYAKPLGALVFRPRARSWWAAIAQTMFGVYLVGMAAYGGSAGLEAVPWCSRSRRSTGSGRSTR